MIDYLVIKPSTIEGVGVFTEENISKGKIINIWGSEGDIRYVENPTGIEEQMCKRFCVETKPGVYCCPLSFNQMSMGWYLNHSDTPNAIVNDLYATAIEDIKAGCEITIDYNTLSEFPNINHE